MRALQEIKSASGHCEPLRSALAAKPMFWIPSLIFFLFVPQVSGTELERKRKKLEKDRKITLSVAVVVGVFIICWGPMNIMLITYCACHNCVSSLAIEASQVLAMLNSGCNPLIYGIFNKGFRRTFKKMLKCQWHQVNRPHNEDSTTLTAGSAIVRVN